MGNFRAARRRAALVRWNAATPEARTAQARLMAQARWANKTPAERIAERAKGRTITPVTPKPKPERHFKTSEERGAAISAGQKRRWERLKAEKGSAKAA